jgi:hypothetical protein
LIDQELLEGAGLAFEAETGSKVRLTNPVVLKDGFRSLVVRCQVESDDAGLLSIIVKQIKKDPARGFNDWASLSFLSRIPEIGNRIPRFYGGNAAQRVYLMSDLGEVENLQHVLDAESTVELRLALRSLATTMASLNRISSEEQERFEKIRSVLPFSDGLDRHHEARVWRDNLGNVFSWFSALECSCPTNFQKSLEHILNAYEQPGEFLGFTHGDPAPTNNYFLAGQSGLLDFEYGGFRHALYDITAWQILCPLPLELVKEMREAFQQELALAAELLRTKSNSPKLGRPSALIERLPFCRGSGRRSSLKMHHGQGIGPCVRP